MKLSYILLIVLFIIGYTFFIFGVDLNISLDFASQLTAVAAFFFALFSGFFIARQNERFSKITDIIAERDGVFSYLYRVFGLIPRMQNEIREVIKDHYTKILDANDWAYNEFHPSMTLSRLTKIMGSVTDEEVGSLKNNNFFDGIWLTIYTLQQNRKRIIAAYQERLLAFQWILIYVFAGITILSFHFLHTDLLWVNILKIVFATAVFLVIILIKQLNSLSIFGKNFSKKIANDVLRIINEIDEKDLAKKSN